MMVTKYYHSYNYDLLCRSQMLKILTSSCIPPTCVLSQLTMSEGSGNCEATACQGLSALDTETFLSGQCRIQLQDLIFECASWDHFCYQLS